MKIINQIALNQNQDRSHHIHVMQDRIVETLTLAEFDRQASSVAQHLYACGVRAGDRIGVLAKNGLEWAILDLAILKLGGVTAGFEMGRFDPVEAVERYGLRLLFADTPPRSGEDIIEIKRIREWTNLEPTRKRFHAGYGAADICALKFTSGSTGQPKGLEATVGSVDDSIATVQRMFDHGDKDNILVFLRLALLQQRYWIYSALAFGHDVTIATMDNVLSAARIAKPTVIMGVPGFFDLVKRQLELQQGESLPSDSVRYAAIQDLLGGRIRYLWTGSAPASRATLDFYNDCGVPLYEGYGLNETCIVAKNCPSANRIGSVGKLLPHKTLRFDTNGVMIVGSRNPVNTSYAFCAPGESERMFLPSGEVVTQDLGHLDEDGYLYVLGRVDDIVSLSSGRNVLVRPLEEGVKREANILECVLYGNGKPFLTAVISAGPRGHRADISAHIARMNRETLPEQQILGLIFAAEPFSIENGLLTSQFKPKRAEIFRRYNLELQEIYAMPLGKGELAVRYAPKSGL
ncbi:MAG TPA: AMP-binding protein [Nitrosospira sp.]|nr:AMP-binding protein [Nitrosospira sp.]